MCKEDLDGPTEPYRTQRHLAPQATSAGGPIEAGLVVENFPVTFDGYTYKNAHIAYVKGRPPAPVVLIHPNYAGLKQFDIDQASYLAKVGYVGLACDLYKETPEYNFGDRNPAPDTSDAGKAAARRHVKGAANAMNGLLKNPKHWRGLMGAYLDAARTHPMVHPEFAGAIGYCLGGQCVLEQVRAGHQIQAGVTFHGLLQSIPLAEPVRLGGHRISKEDFVKTVEQAPNNHTSSCKVLIENGDLDEEVPQEAIDEWRQEMDTHGIDWRFNNHARTPHGFALAPGVWSTAYTEAADRRSTLSMLQLFAEVWPSFPQYPVHTNASGTKLNQQIRSAASSSRL